MTLVRAISDLLSMMPGPDADIADRVKFFQRKAEVFDRVAAEDAEHSTEAAELAQKARTQASELAGGAS
ncbi:hypothetical protein FB566_2359 [Stackebrandtia endophytica]|uniref:Uncharacterized protein n=1 Tax=Stackebrandtia endophytica TaxID=1496996 RepID=A0A543AW94_9ACTN|nr:AMED_5909 family protein [Stackebrandtia endophytica]TQL76819.1 hypothetical protein FB566_2359 [Stackebrandtia endophytica]